MHGEKNHRKEVNQLHQILRLWPSIRTSSLALAMSGPASNPETSEILSRTFIGFIITLSGRSWGIKLTPYQIPSGDQWRLTSRTR